MGKLTFTIAVCALIVASVTIGAIEVLARTAEQEEQEQFTGD